MLLICLACLADEGLTISLKEARLATVDRVIDADTIVLMHHTRIRLYCIDPTKRISLMALNPHLP